VLGDVRGFISITVITFGLAYNEHMIEIKVLLVGRHDKIKGGTHAGSSVVLIKTDDRNILVDTGSFGDRKKLIEALKKVSIKPEDIDIVLVTHTHLDHTANLDLFKKAEIITKHSPQSIGVVFHGFDNDIAHINVDDLEVVKGVRTILTPGHIEAHISVVVETGRGTYVICGDAIQTENQLDMNCKPEKAWNFDEFEKSRKRILEIANYVIPGHGDVLKVK